MVGTQIVGHQMPVGGEKTSNDVMLMIGMEPACLEAEPWSTNTGQQEAALLSSRLAKRVWHRQATLINREVTI